MVPLIQKSTLSGKTSVPGYPSLSAEIEGSELEKTGLKPKKELCFFEGTLEGKEVFRNKTGLSVPRGVLIGIMDSREHKFKFRKIANPFSRKSVFHTRYS